MMFRRDNLRTREEEERKAEDAGHTSWILCEKFALLSKKLLYCTAVCQNYPGKAYLWIPYVLFWNFKTCPRCHLFHSVLNNLPIYTPSSPHPQSEHVLYSRLISFDILTTYPALCQPFYPAPKPSIKQLPGRSRSWAAGDLSNKP